MSLDRPCRCSVTAPFPLPRMTDRLGSDRIEHNITTHLQKVAVLLNENSFKPPLEDMANAAVSLVKCLGINTIELPHSLRQVSIRCFNHQVIVVVHQAIAVANPVEPLGDPSQSVQKQFSVAIDLEDRFAIISAGGDVVKRAVVLDSQGPCHDHR